MALYPELDSAIKKSRNNSPKTTLKLTAQEKGFNFGSSLNLNEFLPCYLIGTHFKLEIIDHIFRKQQRTTLNQHLEKAPTNILKSRIKVHLTGHFYLRTRILHSIR